MAEKNNLKAKIKDSKVLAGPWITEAATREAVLNKYVFKVAPKARKEEIKRAVEAIFGVEVVSVNTLKLPGKKVSRGRTVGFRSGVKKALVTLKAGDTIEFFENK